MLPGSFRDLQHSGLARALMATFAALVTGLSPLGVAAGGAIELSYKVLTEHPHPSNAFTQGLVYSDDVFIESSGLYGRSFVFAHSKSSQKTLHQIDLPKHLFAEGLTVFGDRLFVLTWKRGTALVFNRSNFEELGQFTYKGEGWGLTHDGRHLWMSDGSDTLILRDPDTFAELRQLRVDHNGQPLMRLNELEYALGLIWANVWQDDRIFAISPETGKVLGVVDLRDLVQKNSVTPTHTVLNGIAFDAASGTFWVTGKFWPRLYELAIPQARAMLEAAP